MVTDLQVASGSAYLGGGTWLWSSCRLSLLPPPHTSGWSCLVCFSHGDGKESKPDGASLFQPCVHSAGPVMS